MNDNPITNWEIEGALRAIDQESKRTNQQFQERLQTLIGDPFIRMTEGPRSTQKSGYKKRFTKRLLTSAVISRTAFRRPCIGSTSV